MSQGLDNNNDLLYWLRLIESEYLEMPGLQLTRAQIQRMWGLGRERCEFVLGELETTGVLVRTRDVYVGANRRW
jgi:hypothetical protein